MKSNHFTTKLVLALSLFLLTMLTGFAQDAPKPQLQRVSVTQVKPQF